MRAGRCIVAAAVALLGLVSLPPAGARPAPSATGASTIELVTQTPVAVRGEPFVADVRLRGAPADGSIVLRLHQRIRSRSELAESMDGNGLRCCVFQTATPVSDLAPRPGGARRVVLPLGAEAGGPRLPTEGVYPLELVARDASDEELGTLITHLIVPPEAGDDAPNLGVAVVAELGLPPALDADGTVTLADRDVASLEAIATGLAAAPDVPATLDVRPETLEALQQARDPGHRAVLDAIRATASGRSVLGQPYVSLDLDGLVRADLASELPHQLERGKAVLEGVLGTSVDDGVHVAPESLGSAGLRTLAFTGGARILLDDADVEPLAPGIIRYSLAQPFMVAVPQTSEADDRTPGDILGLTPDPTVVERLDATGSPGLVVSRVLAELALLRLEQPSVARTAVLPLRRGASSDVVQQLLEALDEGRPFEAMTLQDAFEHAAPVLDGGGNPAARALAPTDRDDIPAPVADDLADARRSLATFRSLVGRASPLPDPASRHILVAAAAGLESEERRAHLDAAVAAIDAIASQVSAPATFTLTLTARDGTVPLTLRNGSGVPLHVSVRLRSQKLEFPDGDTIELELTEPTTRVDIRVRSRATGAFPLVIEVRTPDGERTLATSRYTVRSTAVSGVGLAVSVGAGLFLVVWWARHWRRTRRSRRLIAANGHPTAGSPAG